MKATLEFDLPDDQEDFDMAVNGVKWYSAMYELDQWLRGKIKYAPDNMSDDTYNALQATRDQLWEVLKNTGISFD